MKATLLSARLRLQFQMVLNSVQLASIIIICNRIDCALAEKAPYGADVEHVQLNESHVC